MYVCIFCVYFFFYCCLHYIMQYSFIGAGDPPHPSHTPPPMLDSSTLLHNHSSSSVEIHCLQTHAQHKVQRLIVQISSVASWGDLLWSEDRSNRVKIRSVKSPNKASVSLYNIMELIDIVLGKQYVKNNASSILRNIWVETVSMTGSKNNKQPNKKLQVKSRQTCGI